MIGKFSKWTRNRGIFSGVVVLLALVLMSGTAQAIPMNFPLITGLDGGSTLTWGGSAGFGGAGIGHLVLSGTTAPLRIDAGSGNSVDFTPPRGQFFDIDIWGGGVGDMFYIGGTIGAVGGAGVGGLAVGDVAMLAGGWTGAFIAPDLVPLKGELTLTFDTTAAPGTFDFSTGTPGSGTTITDDLGPLFGSLFAIVFEAFKDSSGNFLVWDDLGVGDDGWQVTFIEGKVGPVPEPGTLLLLVSGMAGLVAQRKFRKKVA